MYVKIFFFKNEDMNFYMFVEVARIDEIPVGEMKQVEADGHEILIVNVAGEYYAVGERCGHMNAPLSWGRLDGTVITCPLHSSEFNVTNGKLLSGPVLESLPDLECLPEEYKRLNRERRKLIELTNTYNLPVYELKIESNKILIKVNE